KIEDVDTLYEYSQPLLEVLESLPPNEKVVLVGHSLGGLNIAIAMEKFAAKIEVGVFLTAFVPDTEHKPSYVLEKVDIFFLLAKQYCEGTAASEWLDTSFSQCGNKTSMLFGPNFLSTKVYQLCSIQDLELIKCLKRPSSLFIEDLSQEKNFSKEDMDLFLVLMLFALRTLPFH
ncbi:hypothetical protein PIB30_055166, partial [Stylosanthes scabra]|nr:hypothetical protein [Stylosanthes scabra]